MANDTATTTTTESAGGTTAAAESSSSTATTTTDTTAAVAAAATQTKTDAAVVAAVPETYDIKLATDSTLDASIVDRTAAIARELGLTTNETAQKLLDSIATELTTAQQALAESTRVEVLASLQPGGAAWESQNTANKEAALADAEIGGSPEALDKSVELANNVLRKFGTDKSIEFFKNAGLASSPEAVRLLARIGKAMGEGAIVAPGAVGGELTAEQKLQQMYPTMKAAT